MLIYDCMLKAIVVNKGTTNGNKAELAWENKKENLRTLKVRCLLF